MRSESRSCKKLQKSIMLPIIFMILAAALYGQEVKWIQVGPLHNWYLDVGSEPEEGRTGNATGNEQQDGLRWPALYKWQDTMVGKALWIGTTDFNDPVTGETYPYKVVAVGPRSQMIDRQYTFMPEDFKLIGRSNHPLVLVDDIPASDLEFTDRLDDINENLPTDRMILNKVNTSIGITMTRKIYYNSQQYHNQYFIYDYVFKNTGIIDKEGTKVSKKLTGVIFFFQYRYAIGHEAWQLGDYPDEVNWGRNTVNDARNEMPVDPGPPPQWAEDAPPRCLFSWHGKHSALTFDNIGGPFVNTDGHLAAQQFVGVITLHADKEAKDQSDDPYQPTTTMFQGADNALLQYGNGASAQYNQTLMTDRYLAMQAGHPAQGQRHADLVGDGPANEYGNDAGGYVQTQGFGPYDLEPGDSIHIVLAEAVAGISREKGYEVGKTWLEAISGGGSGIYTLPDGSTTSDPDEYKDKWVFTGRDSLFQTFSRAISAYQNNLDTPKPPPPPEFFNVESGGDRIKLTWAKNAEKWPNLKGYNIYRAVNRRDSTDWQLLFTCEKPNLVYEYNDTSAIRGLDYYYYIVSYDDGSTNDIQPGVPLESSLFYTLTSEPAFLRRPAEKGLDNIIVVPNPFDIRAKQFGENAPDRIAFFDLPPVCTIKIYTERGDLIATIEHTDGTGDEFWNSITSSRQVIVSGIYIAHFQTPEGQSATRKIIIIR